MFRNLMDRWWMIAVVVLAVMLSGCGGLAGEPKTVSEIEILPEPTTPAPAATAIPTEESVSPGAAAETTPTAEPAAVSGAYDPASADYDRGMQVYLSQCAVCHGASQGVGPSLSGMGERAAAQIAGMSAADYLYQSIVDPGAYLVEGYENVMPATYDRDLAAQDINDVIRFILEFDPALMMGAQATPSPGAASAGQQDVLTVRGRLVQGTANGEVIPAGLAMQLYALNMDGDLVGTYETQSGENGSYRFDNVARAAGNVYVVQVTYNDIPQGAQIQAIQGDEKEVTSDVTLYERTTDPSTVAITWAQILINFAPIEEFGLEVWLSLELANTGDKIVTTDQTAGVNNWFVSTSLQLPVGAFGIQPMQAETSQRYDVQVVDGVPEVRDTWPLRPGQVHAITVAYYLPYENGAVIDQSFSYPVVDAAVLVPNDTVSFSSDQLDVTGEWCCRVSHGGVRVTELGTNEKINPDKDFTLVSSHNLDTPLKANERLIFELAGRPTRTLEVMSTSPSSSPDSTTSNLLPMILAAAGGAIITLAGVLWWRQRSSPPPVVGQPVLSGTAWKPPAASAGKEELLEAVAELDDAYEAGKLDDETYQERRELLLERLLPLMEDEKP